MVAVGGGQGLTRQAARSGPCNAAKLFLILIPVLFKFLSCKPQNLSLRTEGISEESWIEISLSEKESCGSLKANAKANI